jgi:hypothetical protein
MQIFFMCSSTCWLVDLSVAYFDGREEAMVSHLAFRDGGTGRRQRGLEMIKMRGIVLLTSFCGD